VSDAKYIEQLELIEEPLGEVLNLQSPLRQQKKK
jgi:hypothetical protein